MSENKILDALILLFEGGVSLLTVLFIGLKLTGHIDWSWWWVLSPIWITTAIIVLALIVCIIIAALTD